MKAIVYTKYGPPEVLQLAEVATPNPKDNEVLIRVHASSINAAESHIVKGEPFLVRLMVGGILKPGKPIPGADVAGKVEAVGRDVKQFQVGDEVFGDLGECGWGAFAEYVCAPESALVLKPKNISFASAASVPLAGVTALQGLRGIGKIQSGQKVLINGASGGVGTFAVQIAKSFGAEVTGVCSPTKVEMVRSIGADHVMDYRQTDITQIGQQYDLIFDIASYRSFLDYKGILAPSGTYVLAGGSTARIFQTMLQGPLASRIGTQKFTSLMAKPNTEDLAFLKGLIEAGSVTPVIDKCYPLEAIVEAFRYFEGGHTRGKVVITVAQ
jgi:NADPH:quinone reductase-like Zn-dependent oxidoreductase